MDPRRVRRAGKAATLEGALTPLPAVARLAGRQGGGLRGALSRGESGGRARRQVALWRQSGMPASQLLLVSGPHSESGVPVAGQWGMSRQSGMPARQSGMPASQLLLVSGLHGESGVPVGRLLACCGGTAASPACRRAVPSEN